MALLLHGFPQIKLSNKTPKTLIKSSSSFNNGNKNPSSYKPISLAIPSSQKKCLRCGTPYQEEENSPNSCSFHGHTTGESGLFALAPPHQGIDGEWSDASGVIVYKWNEKERRPNTGRENWKRRWSCCQEYDQNAPPCMRGRHVSYDDGYTLY
ncbi:hypothetical protein LUZ60_003350 [Juncus effusus]|nr:hypothetical protein LUZ60_003350 [Juncus effusus]